MQYLSKQERANRMCSASHINYNTCLRILSEFFKDNKRGLAINAERLLTSDQNEELKQRGLTIFDCVIGQVEDFDNEFVTEMFAEWNERLGEKIFMVPVEA